VYSKKGERGRDEAAAAADAAMRERRSMVYVELRAEVGHSRHLLELNYYS
jgi:hypothetical protein